MAATTLSRSLPLNSSTARTLTNAPTVSTESEGLTNVLIGDRSSTVRKILSHMLQSMGCKVTEVEDGEQALEIARQRPIPQAPILSAQLPKIDGINVCQTLKRDEVFQLTPIMLMAENDSSEEYQQILDAGADDYIRKPIHRVELTFRARTLLRVQKSNEELIGAESLALALARVVAAKDGYSHSHVERVASHAEMLGRALGLQEVELRILRYGAIVHNVGKISIPDSVLEKSSALTPREMAMFQQHPRVGCDICAPLKPLKAVVPIIRHHKERWDGTGFPDGLRGDEIPLGAQIVGLVDGWSAMTSHRPYRPAAGHDEAVQMLRNQAEDGIYDPALVECFVECLQAIEGLADE